MDGIFRCGPHMQTSKDDISLLPKALRGSQAPEGRAQPLRSSGTQPVITPGAAGVSAKPLGLKKEG